MSNDKTIPETELDKRLAELQVAGQSQLGELGKLDALVEKLKSDRNEMLMRASEISAQMKLLQDLKNTGSIHTLAMPPAPAASSTSQSNAPAAAPAESKTPPDASEKPQAQPKQKKPSLKSLKQ